eukprot:m.274554 g.274554  ORF g.274554 m.274554 type:complete len:66 (+) comp70296_c0_seq1:92-289(+)
MSTSSTTTPTLKKQDECNDFTPTYFKNQKIKFKSKSKQKNKNETQALPTTRYQPTHKQTISCARR